MNPSTRKPHSRIVTPEQAKEMSERMTWINKRSGVLMQLYNVDRANGKRMAFAEYKAHKEGKQ